MYHGSLMQSLRRHYPWVVVCLLLLVWMLNYLDRQLIFSIFPLLQADLHVSPLQLGLLGTAFLWVYAAASPFAGYLADRTGSKRLIVSSLLVWSTLTLLTGRAKTYHELLVLRALMGVSEACYLPAGLALIAAYHSRRTRSRAVSLHYSGTYLGTVLGGVLGGWLGARTGWRPVFSIFGAMGCAYAAVLLFSLHDRQGAVDSLEAGMVNKPAALPRSGGLLSSLREVVHSAGYGRILIVFAVASICDWAIYTWMPLYLYESFGFSLAKAGFTATFYMKAGGFAGLLLGGVLADGWARRSVGGRALTQATGLLLAAPFLVVSGMTHQPALLLVAMVLFGLGKGMYDGNTMPLLCERVPVALRATAFGLLNFAGTFAGGAVAAAAGALKRSVGLGHVFAVSGVLLLMSAVLLATVRGHPSQYDGEAA